MNEKDFDKGINELKNIRLSETEKKAIFKNIMSAPIESPYVKRSPIFISIFASHARVFVAASLVFVVSFGGVIYASDDALPGDVLYPVKTAVVESVLDVVYSAPEKKLVWEEEKVERRIAEAEKLIEKDELDDDKLAQLEARIEKSSIAFARTAGIVASSTATSSFSRTEKAKKIKQEFKTKINNRMIVYDDDRESEESAAATMMMSVPVSSQDRVLNELTDEGSKRSGKNPNKDKIERLKRAATKNLNGDHDDDEKDSRGNGRGEEREDDEDRDDEHDLEVEIKINDLRI